MIFVPCLSVLFRFYAFIPLLFSGIVIMNCEADEGKLAETKAQVVLSDEQTPLIPQEYEEIEELGLLGQIESGKFIGITLILSIYMIKLNFYISTMSDQMISLGKISSEFEDYIPSIISFFNLCLPIGGILSIPLIGVLLDNFSFHISFTLLCICGLLFSVLR